MIIARSPLRITLGGGGTDLPSYYRNHEGLAIAAAIDKYVYVTVNRPFSPGVILKYSRLEHAQQVSGVDHPIVRESLRALHVTAPQIEITSIADIPAGTGLGSSGSFTTALLKALHLFYRRQLSQRQLAELACEVEMERLAAPIGKQDQYIAAIGGIACLHFACDGAVRWSSLALSTQTILELEDNLLLFYTGMTRSASALLAEQNMRTLESDAAVTRSLHAAKELALQSRAALEAGDVRAFGELMLEHWERKKHRCAGVSNGRIDEWYEIARRNGAIGGKLVGAGGGGFLMFLAEDRDKLRRAMLSTGLEEVRFRFDFEGTKTVLVM